MPYFDLITEADPDRLLNQLLEHTIFLPREQWLKQAGAIVKHAYGVGLFHTAMKQLIKEVKPRERRTLMHDLEQAFFDALPDKVEIYRLAANEQEARGFRWLLDEPLAYALTQRAFNGEKPMSLYVATVSKKDGFVKSTESGYLGFDFYLAIDPDRLAISCVQVPTGKDTGDLIALNSTPQPENSDLLRQAQRQFEDEALIIESRERDYAINFDAMTHCHAPKKEYTVLTASAKSLETLHPGSKNSGAHAVSMAAAQDKAHFLAYCRTLPPFKGEKAPLFLFWSEEGSSASLPSYLFKGTDLRADAWEWLALPSLHQRAISAWVRCFDFFRDVETTLNLAQRYCVSTPQSFNYILEGITDSGRLNEFATAFTPTEGGFIFRVP